MIWKMEYYQIMMLLGGFILYMLLNIYPIIVYLIGIIKERDFKELLIMPLTIIGLLIPLIGSMYGFLIVDFGNKWYQILYYIGIYLIVIGFIINLVVAFNV